MRKRSGVTLVLVLLTILSIFILSSAFLTQKLNQQKASRLVLAEFQAQQIAQSALETVKVKLRYDPNFPPSNLAAEQPIFSYTEEMTDPSNGNLVGNYRVDCDRRWLYQNRLCVTVTATVGRQANPVQHRLRAEFSMMEFKRGDLILLVDDSAPVR